MSDRQGRAAGIIAQSGGTFHIPRRRCVNALPERAGVAQCLKLRMTDTIELAPARRTPGAPATAKPPDRSEKGEADPQGRWPCRGWALSTRPRPPPPSRSIAAFYRACAAGRCRRAQPARSGRRGAVAVAFCRAAAPRPGQDPGLQPRAGGRWLVVAAHDRRDRQRRHAVSRRFGDRRDQCRRPRRPSGDPSDPDASSAIRAAGCARSQPTRGPSDSPGLRELGANRGCRSRSPANPIRRTWRC